MSDFARIYAVGDIHGQLDMLRGVHAAILADLEASPCESWATLHIGDYVDRGPDSRGVIEYLVARAEAGAPDINLLGNHDRMFRRFLEKPGGRDPMLRRELHWLHPRLGGLATLRSYGLETPEEIGWEDEALWRAPAKAAVPAAHLAFLAGLRDCFHWGGWFFAHAGVSPGLSLAMQDEDDLIWIREPFLKSRRDHGAVVVHGHTPVEEVEDHGNRIAIDTGAGYGGPLTCLVLEGEGARILGGPTLR